MRFDIVTIFPKVIEAALAEGVVGRGIASGLVDLQVHDLREFTTDRHRSVDDVPYGGGPGMVMMPGPLVKAVEKIRATRGAPESVIVTSPQGRAFTQREAERLAASGMWPSCAADTRGWTSACCRWSGPRNCRLAITC